MIADISFLVDSTYR